MCGIYCLKNVEMRYGTLQYDNFIIWQDKSKPVSTDFLPKQARWRYFVCIVSCRKKCFFLQVVINSLLTKLVWSRWLDIGLVLFWCVFRPWLCLGPSTCKKELGQYTDILTSCLFSNPYVLILSKCLLNHLLSFVFGLKL